MLGNYLQQTTSADVIFQMHFFLGALRVKTQKDYLIPTVSICVGKSIRMDFSILIVDIKFGWLLRYSLTPFLLFTTIVVCSLICLFIAKNMNPDQLAPLGAV